MEPKGISSGRQLATKSGVSPETIWRMFRGEGVVSHETVVAVADVLFGGDRNRVYELAESARRDHGGTFELPPDASRLTPRQRDAVLAVVRSMLDPTEEGGGQVAVPTPIEPGSVYRPISTIEAELGAAEAALADWDELELKGEAADEKRAELQADVDRLKTELSRNEPGQRVRGGSS
jgi:transcriptional regulator with XRE-family HTH domain